jgi:G3E family GTPase
MSLFDRDRSAERHPVSLITGFLGSGKTTLVNHLLGHAAMAGTLVIVNEFGEIGLDQAFIASRDQDMVLMSSGCICCSIKGDLEATLRDIIIKRQAQAMPPFSRVLIETTGLADPAPIVALLLNHPFVSYDYRLDAVVTTVDAVHGMRQLDEQPEPVRQAAIADRLVVTKADLADDDALRALEARLAALNPAAPLSRVAHGRIAPDSLFGAGPFAATDRSETARGWIASEAYAAPQGHQATCLDPDCGDPSHRGQGRHDARIKAVAVTVDRPLDWPLLADWLAALRHSWASHLLRVKGILALAGESGPVVIHGVHDTFHPPVALPDWPDEDHRSRLVFILRDLPPSELMAAWSDFLAAQGEAWARAA